MSSEYDRKETVQPSTDVPIVGEEATPHVLTAQELAELLRVNVETVYRQARKGRIPGCRRVGRHLRFCSRTVLNWLAEGNGRVSRQRGRS